MSSQEKLLQREFLNLRVKDEIGYGLVYRAFRLVDRADFTPDEFRQNAYRNKVIGLGSHGRGLSLSQPVLVAQMIDNLRLKGAERILEIGTGTGYAAAILAFCTSAVVDTVEYNPSLVESARERFMKLGLINVRVHQGDGALGWPESAPYDAILVSAGAREVPRALGDQLAEEGRMVIPVGKDPDADQDLVVAAKLDDKLFVKKIFPVGFHFLYSSACGGWTTGQIIKVREAKELFLRKYLEASRCDDNKDDVVWKEVRFMYPGKSWDQLKPILGDVTNTLRMVLVGRIKYPKEVFD